MSANDWSVISAPTGLGLRPPGAGSVPGTSKAPEALREVGLLETLAGFGVSDAGVVLPGRYRDDGDPSARRLRNHDAILDHADRLASRIDGVLETGRRPLVLGGDCSLLLAAGIASSQRGGCGLVHVDGHTDFRHPGNSDQCVSLAGEDLAAAIGLHWPTVSDHRGLGPYFPPGAAVHIGCRDNDEHLTELRDTIGMVLPASELLTASIPDTATRAIAVAGSFWLHVDVDVLDPLIFPAVDSPDAGGLDVGQLTELLVALLPGCIGLQITVYDPDLDPDLRFARILADLVANVLRN